MSPNIAHFLLSRNLWIFLKITQAASNPIWEEAMDLEIKSLEENNTWDYGLLQAHNIIQKNRVRISLILLYVDSFWGDWSYLQSLARHISVQVVSQFVSAPKRLHLTVVHHIILQGTSSRGPFFSSNSSPNWADADWSGFPDTRWSISWWCMFLVILSFHGNVRNNLLFQNPLQKQII